MDDTIEVIVSLLKEKQASLLQQDMTGVRDGKLERDVDALQRTLVILEEERGSNKVNKRPCERTVRSV